MIPTSPIDPEDNEEADENPNTPPLTYAQVFNGKFRKPKIPIAQNIIDDNPEDKLVDNSKIEDEMDENQRDIIGQAIEESARIIGFSPITENMKTAEAEKIMKNGLLNSNRDKRDLYETATKNLVDKFMKNKLQMDNFSRNQVKIIQIYPSQSDRSPTIYIKCQSEEDISLITSHAHNLPRPDPNCITDTIVPHIPKIMYQRCKACEKLLWQYRKSNQGNIQTNLRLGRFDFLLRTRDKGDQTPWKFITPIKIPNTFPKPETNLWKKPEINNENQQKDPRTSSPLADNTHPTSPTGSGMEEDEYTNSASELNLRKAAKHNMSESPNSLENSSKKLHEDPPHRNNDNSRHQDNDNAVTQDFVKTPSLNKVQDKLSNQVTMFKVISPTNANNKYQDGC